MQTFDFQVHSTHSDGDRTPTQLTYWCAQLGITTFSITDHNTSDGVVEGQQAAAARGITCVAGVELTTHYHVPKGKIEEVDLLVYGFDLKNPVFLSLLREQQQKQAEYSNDVRDCLTDAGLYVSSEHIASRTAMAQEVFADQRNVEMLQAKGMYSAAALRTQLIDQVSQSFVSPFDILKAAEAAGGYVVVGCDLVLKHDLSDLQHVARYLKAIGFAGIECFHPACSAVESAQCVEITKRAGLFVTGSSDYHKAPRSASDPKSPGDWSAHDMVVSLPVQFGG